MGNYANTACYAQEYLCLSKDEDGSFEEVSVADKLARHVDGSWQSVQPQMVLPDRTYHSANKDGLEKPSERATGIHSIVSAMVGFPNDATIQVRSCRSLLSIAQQPSHQHKVVASGSIEAIISAMQSHPEDEDLQHLACGVLGYLASLQEGQSRLLAADGADAIITSMGNHPESLSIQRAGCQALVNVPQILEDPQFTTTDAVVNVVLSAMRLHPLDCCVQETACSILWCASLHEAGRSLVVSCGGVETTVLAMKAFPGTCGIQRLGCGLFLHIATCSNFQKSLVEFGGLSAVISAVVMHPQDVRILRRVCGVLGALGASRQFAKALSDAGAIPAILTTLPKHRSQVFVQESACEALRIIVQGSASFLGEVDAKLVIAEMVVVLLQLSEAKLRELAMRVIYLLITDAYAHIVESAGTVDVVLSTMQAHAADPDIQEAGQAILDALLRRQLLQEPNAVYVDFRENRYAAETRTPSKESEHRGRNRTPRRQESPRSDDLNLDRAAANREYTFHPPKKSPPKIGPTGEEPRFGEVEVTSLPPLLQEPPKDSVSFTDVTTPTRDSDQLASQSPNTEHAVPELVTQISNDCPLKHNTGGQDLRETVTETLNDAPSNVEESPDSERPLEHNTGGQDLRETVTETLNDAPSKVVESPESVIQSVNVPAEHGHDQVSAEIVTQPSSEAPKEQSSGQELEGVMHQ